MAKVLIVGQPKTGTTVLFHKIRQAMPSTTREYFEPSPRLLAKIAAQRNPGPVLVKSLCMDKNPLPDVSSFDKLIFILRDPRDQLISSLFYRTHELSAIDRDDSLLDPENFQSLVNQLRQKEQAPAEHSIFDIFPCLDRMCQKFSTYHENVSSALETPGFFRFKYEDMVAGRLESLEEYLGFPLETQTQVSASHERVSRSKSSGSWRHFLLPAEVPAIRESVRSYLEEHGYDDDWELADPQFIRPEECSQYVTKVVQLRLRDLKQELQEYRDAANQKEPLRKSFFSLRSLQRFFRRGSSTLPDAA